MATPDIGGDTHALADLVASDALSQSLDVSRKLMTKNNSLARLELSVTVLNDSQICPADAAGPHSHPHFILFNPRNRHIHESEFSTLGIGYREHRNSVI